MSQTPNLGLTLINGSDVVDYQVFNKNFTELDKASRDYVTDTGTTNRWWWRKWKSGRAECGIDNMLLTNNQNANFNTSWGAGLYRCQDFDFGNFPLTFSAKPYCSVVLSYCAGDYTGPVVQHAAAGGTNKAPAFYFLRPTTGTVSSCQWSIFVAGWI